MTVETNPTLWGSYNVVSASGDLDTVSTLPDGGYVLAWRENGLIRFQLYNGNGDKVGGPRTLDAPIVENTSQWQPDILTQPDGSFVITWTEGTGAASGGRILRSQTFDMHGGRLGDAVTLDPIARADGVHTVTNGNGGLMTAFVKHVQDGPNSSLRLSFAETTATGTVTTSTNIEAAGEVNIDWLGGTLGYAVSYLHDNDLFISVIKDGVVTTFTTDINNINESDLVALKDANGNPNGRFVVTYVDTYTHKVTVDTFYIENNAIVRDTTVALGPQTTDSTGLKTSITALRDGGYAVAYKGQADGYAEIFVKVFDAEGHEGPAIRIPISGHQDMPSITEMADGRLAVSWHDRGVGNGPIETAIVDARAAAVTVVGTGGNDVYAPSKHAGDNLDGGDGIDTLTFKESKAGVAVNLADENGTAGDATGDTYKNFENIIGSRFNDSLIGNDLSNTIQGGAGNDILNGGAGADRLEGGTGNDTYYVYDAGDRVVETSTGGTMDVVSTSVSHTLSSYVERLYASGSASINLTGNSLSNVIKGNAGTNKIYGGAGNDVLYGGSGKDYFVFNTTPSSSSNKDRIMDWSSRDDTIYLDNAVFRKLTKTGMLSSSYFKVSSTALDANDYIGYNRATGDLWYDSNGNAAGGQVTFANIGANKSIAYYDFVII